jgi:hypothetical protein
MKRPTALYVVTALAALSLSSQAFAMGKWPKGGDQNRPCPQQSATNCSGCAGMSQQMMNGNGSKVMGGAGAQMMNNSDSSATHQHDANTTEPANSATTTGK